MKNITRRGFLQLAAVAALVCATAPLTGCRKKNIKKLVLGGTRVFVVISLGTVTPAVLAGVFVLVQRFCIWF